MRNIDSALQEASNAIYKGCEDVWLKRIFHYTSPDGLMGIFNDGSPSLWFSQYDSLNDPNERKDFFEVLHKYCVRQKKSRRMSEELYEKITAIKASDVYGFIFDQSGQETSNKGNSDLSNAVYSSREGYTYVCSFSKNKDSLSMWKRYTKTENNVGYNIEFFTHKFKYKNFSKEGYRLHIIEVVYDDEEKFNLIEQVMSHIMPVYDSATENEKESAINIVKMMIKEYQFKFKRAYFADEEEIRAVLQIPKIQTNNIKQITERKYRVNNGLIIPYVIYKLDKSAIASIVVSPTTKDEILKDYMCSKGLEHVKIEPSNITDARYRRYGCYERFKRHFRRK